jgi:D-3-phosphoglycerate dehydrogenase
LDELFARADFITLHTPLTEQTKNILDAKALAKCKKGVRIVNCARGGLIVEEDLKAALESGQVAGVALDVFAVEPAKDSILFGMEQVICTPHLGASTSEAQEKVALQVAEQLSDYLMTGAVVNALNSPSVSAEDAPKLKPYMQLAEQLGSFAGQVTQSGLRGITIEYEGHVAELNTKPLTALVVMGLLSPLLDSVNMVNAPVIARERNIDITEVKRERAGDYHTLIRLTIVTEQRTRSITGSLFGGDKPRLVGIDEVPIEAELSTHMLYIRNEDKPGFIGRLGATLGDAGVNIASFHLGRTSAGENAIALVSVDQRIGDDVLAKIAALPSVVQARVLRF